MSTEIQPAGCVNPCRHIPMLFTLVLEQRHGMSARSWSVCEKCDAEIYRADGEPWTAYVATPEVQAADPFAGLPSLTLTVRKVAGGYEADLSGLIVECRDSSGLTARASSCGATHTAARHQDAVSGVAAGLFQRLFGAFVNGPLGPDAHTGHVIDSCPTCPTTSTTGSQSSR